MNLVLLFPEDFIDQNFDPAKHTCDTVLSVSLTGRRREHIQNVQRASIGDRLRVGLVNGKMGHGTLTHCGDDRIDMSVELNQEPPCALPITLIVALPRPKMLKRTLQTIATMGVKKLIFINSIRVEKSYWQTPILKPESIQEHLTLGLEQARDTVMPEVILEKRFKPFVEDRLPAIVASNQALIAHPGLGNALSKDRNHNDAVVLAVGPEGGFIEYEVEKLQACGFKGIHLGDRILRVETAIPVLLAKLF